MKKILSKFKEMMDYCLKWFFQYIDRVDEHHLFLISAGIAFNILLYLIPLLLVALFIVNLTIGQDKINSILLETMDSFLPPTPMNIELMKATLNEINQIMKSSTTAGWIGIITLLWLSSTLLSSIRSGLNRIFNVKTTKIFLLYRFKDIILIICLTIFFLILSFFIPGITIVKESIANLNPPYDLLLSSFFISTFTMSITFILFFFIFKVIPNHKIPGFVAVLSTLISVVIVEMSRHVFAWYVLRFGTYGKFYGTYAVLVSVAVWIYYLTMIILFSAEFSQLIHEKYLNWRIRKSVEKTDNI